MRKKWNILLGFLLVALLLPAQGGAADGDKITMQLSAARQVVTEVAGKEQVSFVAAERANPGDILRYRIEYVNSSSEAVYNFAIVDPIPAGSLFLTEKGDSGTRTMFSIDKGFSYHEPPLYYEEVGADGTVLKKKAGPERFTHIKWQFTEPIPPGQRGVVSFTAKVK